MSTPQERVQSDLRDALKAGDKERLSTLRMLLTAVKNEKIRAGKEVDERAFTGLVRKAIKQREDSAEQYRKGDRQELAAKEEREAEILSVYMPKEPSESEIRHAVEELVAAEGLSGPQAIGAVMKATIARFEGRADGRKINQIAREVLG